ncbi:MAG: hypothetical protein M1380_07375 [Chloroflexi bacterium]|nr:hypothetical protein [Chloroflexota bacterium]
MNENQRFMAILHGQVPDRIPWVARMALWYTYHKSKGTLPEKYRDWELWDIQRDLGVGIMGRTRLYGKNMKGVEARTHQKGNELLTEYVTPVGTVTTLHKVRPDLAVSVYTGEVRSLEVGIHRADYAYQSEHMIKGVEDYPIVEYIIENTEVVPAYEDYLGTAQMVGGDGVALAMVDRVPIQDVLIHFIGFERAFYELYDHVSQVEHLLQLLTDFHKEKLWPICLDAPTELIETGANLSGIMTTPALFESYFAPYTREYAQRLHAKGKLLGTHLDGDPAPLLKEVPRSGLDMVEAFTPAPMTNCTVGDARKAYDGKVMIWGGIPSTILCPDSMDDEQFDAQMRRLLKEVTPGDGFILGVGDNIMPEASLERVILVREMVEKYGRFPIQVA